MFSYNECSKNWKQLGRIAPLEVNVLVLDFMSEEKIKTDIEKKYWMPDMFSLLRYFLLTLSKKILVII